MIEDAFRERIQAWLRANNIDPSRVPVQPYVAVSEGQISIDMFVTNTEGRVQSDPSSPGRPWTKTFAVPLVVEPDAVVKLWIGPRCPECGQ